MKHLLILLLLIPLVNAQEIENYHQYSSLDLDFSLSAEINTESSKSSSLDYLNTQLNIIPQSSDRQSTSNQKESATPTAEITEGETILFSWDKIYDTYTYNYESKVKTKNIIYQIPHIQFPIEEKLPEDVAEFTEAAKIIDINQDIIKQANEIVEGQTDLFTAVFLLADWTKTNINYDLNTLTKTAELQSSWVLKNKKGVCDEMTALFISMARSVGIPARFIAGRVYTNIDYTFGNHGWAEVYFPEVGWVPYDPTFGHYAWIDPTHITLSRTIDSAEPAVSFSWKANNVDVIPQELTLETSVISTGEKVTPIYDLDVEPLEDNVGPGSYVPIKIITKTPYNKFTSNTITVIKAPDLTEDNVKAVLLEPNTEKETYWIVKIPEEAESGFTYSTKIEVKDLFGSTAQTDISYAKDNRVTTKQEAEDTVNSLLKTTKTYSEELSLSCSSSKEYYFLDEIGEILCTIKNTGNKQLTDIEICFLDCQSTSLGISEEKEITFQLDPKELPPERKVTAKVQEIELEDTLSITIYEEANLRILDIDAPDTASYNDIITLEIILDSPTKVTDVKISVNNQEALTIEEIQGSQSTNIQVPASNLVKGINLRVDYKDEKDKLYKTQQSREIEITGVPFYAKILSFFKNLF